MGPNRRAAIDTQRVLLRVPFLTLRANGGCTSPSDSQAHSIVSYQALYLALLKNWYVDGSMLRPEDVQHAFAYQVAVFLPQWFSFKRHEIDMLADANDGADGSEVQGAQPKGGNKRVCTVSYVLSTFVNIFARF